MPDASGQNSGKLWRQTLYRILEPVRAPPCDYIAQLCYKQQGALRHPSGQL